MFQIGDVVQRGNGARSSVGAVAEIISEKNDNNCYRVMLLSRESRLPTRFKEWWAEEYCILLHRLNREPDWIV